MGYYNANITIMLDTFSADNGGDAGQIVNDYVTQLFKAIEDAGGGEVTWNDCDFVVYEIVED